MSPIDEKVKVYSFDEAIKWKTGKQWLHRATTQKNDRFARKVCEIKDKKERKKSRDVKKIVIKISLKETQIERRACQQPPTNKAS